MSDPEFLEVPGGTKIALRHYAGPESSTEPTLVFLPGYMSDMSGGKATALFDWAKGNGRACLLLDYSGCGSSSGHFADGSLSQWRDEVLAVIAARVTGPVTIIGSSMGGWLMLLVAEALQANGQLTGMIGIAPAPDFSEWGIDAADQAKLAAGETIYKDNPYGPEPTPTHAKFWQDAEQQKRLNGVIPIDAPVRLLHGQRDADVPWDISLKLAKALRSDDIQLHFVKDGDHRLSRPQDIALLLRIVAAL